MTLADPSLLDGNLKALAGAHPELAARVEAVPIPDSVTEAIGRDGSKTLRLVDGRGQSVWFGRSSMPTVSAAAVVGSAGREGGNVLLPGVLTGHEIVLILRNLWPHCAVFVIEPDLTHIKLALCLRDYAKAIAGGRLVFVADENPTGELITFFERHPGYDLPRHMLTPPQHTHAHIADLRRMLENTSERVACIQEQTARALAGRIKEQDQRPKPDRPRVVVVSTDASPATLEQAGRIQRALAELSWPAWVCVPDHPARCAASSRLQTIQHAQADLVLCVNCSPRFLRPHLPDWLPVSTWYLPGAVLGRDMSGELGAGDVAFACSRVLCDSLVSAGADQSRVEHLAAGADTTLFSPSPQDASDTRGIDRDVAVIADLPPESPEASGVNLHSHVDLWRGIGKALASRADTYRSKDAAEILKEAQRLSGVELVDPPVRNQFLSLLRVRIAPRVIALSMIESLSASGYRLALWGANWPAPAKGPDLRKGPIPVGEALARLFRESSVVLFPVSSPHWLQLALDALATGAAVAFRSPGNSLEEKYPMLADLSERLHVYASRNKLREMVRELTVNAGHESSELAGPQELMRSKHSVARRLEMMWHVIRERGGGQR